MPRGPKVRAACLPVPRTARHRTSSRPDAVRLLPGRPRALPVLPLPVFPWSTSRRTPIRSPAPLAVRRAVAAVKPAARRRADPAAAVSSNSRQPERSERSFASSRSYTRYRAAPPLSPTSTSPAWPAAGAGAADLRCVPPPPALPTPSSTEINP
jgi:hypothetical protein